MRCKKHILAFPRNAIERAAYAKFLLDQNYEYWITVNPRYQCTQERLIKEYVVLFKTRFFGAFGPYSKHTIILEKNLSRSGYHLHALFKVGRNPMTLHYIKAMIWQEIGSVKLFTLEKVSECHVKNIVRYVAEKTIDNRNEFYVDAKIESKIPPGRLYNEYYKHWDDVEHRHLQELGTKSLRAAKKYLAMYPLRSQRRIELGNR